MSPARLRVLLLSLLAVLSAAIQCGQVTDLSAEYLDAMKHHSENGEVTNFVPSAYFGDIATSKYVTTVPGVRSIYDDRLCVDGGTAPTEIELHDNGQFGDDVAGDGVYSRACVHFCESVVDYSDIFGFAWVREAAEAHLMAVDPSQRNQIPHRILPNSLYPDATLMATSHVAFFVDQHRVYMPDWPESVGSNGDAPRGKSAAVASVLAVFGDVFDYVTLSSYEMNTGFSGAGIYKWQNWVRTGGPTPEEDIGDVESDCVASMTGVPITRLVGVMTVADILNDSAGLIHELIHGVSGYEYNNNLDKARSGDGQHVPGSCTFDHSQLQGPLWDWVRGLDFYVPMPYCIGADNDCRPQENDYVRVEANNDCASCPENQLTSCCTFRYEYAYANAAHMIANPEINNMSPLMQYIAGFISYDEMMALPNTARTYYCVGPDTDGGCGDVGAEDFFPCIETVDDRNTNRVTTTNVERFTFGDLVEANGGKRDPPRRAVNDLRHAPILVGQRMPSEAEMTFYTLFWRHQEFQTQPYERVPEMGRSIVPIYNWFFASGGKSKLHSRLHGIPCGGGVQPQSCVDSASPCSTTACGDNAECILLDSRPLCICNDGFVGDGTLCVISEETLSFPLPSAFETSSECFSTRWTGYVLESELPSYPGGYDPFRARACSTNCVAPDVPPELTIPSGSDGVTCGELFCFSKG